MREIAELSLVLRPREVGVEISGTFIDPRGRPPICDR
jgi:hypothetical protein